MKAAYGVVEEVKTIRTRQVCAISIELPIESYKDAVALLHAQNVLITIAGEPFKYHPYGVIDSEHRAVIDVKLEIEKPDYGKLAVELHKSGFFINPQVCKAIGSEDEYFDWLRRQNCCITGSFDWYTEQGEGRCEVAHVRNINRGAGTSVKPPYWSVPMVHKIHQEFQHQHGEQAAYAIKRGRAVTVKEAKEFFTKTASEYLTKWAKDTLKRDLCVESLKDASPEMMLAWAREHGVESALPMAYRSGRNG